MLLQGKTAVIYGGAGAIGGAVARTFASEGAAVYLAGRDQASVEAVAKQITATGGSARASSVDALDPQAVAAHMDMVTEQAGRIDISINAIGVNHVQGIPLVDLSLHDYVVPITAYTRANFLTATAAARYMIAQRSGVILTISTPGAVMSHGIAGGFGVACAAVEGLSRQLAGELGQYGVRVVCLRPDAVPEAARVGSHSAQVFGHRAQLLGKPLDEFLDGFAEGTLLGRSPTLAEVADVAAFMASDRAGAVTATVADITAGGVAA